MVSFLHLVQPSFARRTSPHKKVGTVPKKLRRISDHTYGICMTCGNLIDKNRLIHSPFVKTCTGCQRKLEAAK